MRAKAYNFEVGLTLLIGVFLLPTLYIGQEIYLRFVSAKPYEFRGSVFIDGGVVSLLLIMLTLVLIISVLILHIPISLYFRKRFAKPKFKSILPIIIALCTHFMIIFIGVLIYGIIYGVVYREFSILPVIAIVVFFYIPSFLPIFLPPLLTLWKYGRTYEYYDDSDALEDFYKSGGTLNDWF